MDLSGKDRSLVTLGCLLVRLAALRVARDHCATESWLDSGTRETMGL